MVEVRRADFAGSWYPGIESECLKTIESFSNDSLPCPGNSKRIVGGIVPHAGFGLGIERLLSWICKLSHVREAIPFPRLINRLYP